MLQNRHFRIRARCSRLCLEQKELMLRPESKSNLKFFFSGL